MIPKLPLPHELLDLLPDAVCVVDMQGRFLYVSAAFERIFGYAPGEALGLRTFDLVHPDDRAATVTAAEDVMAGRAQRHFRNRYIHKSGHSIDIQWSAHWLPDHNVRVAIAREVTELRRAEEQLEHLAGHDPLTDLPNRHRLQVELQHAIRHADNASQHLAVLYLDLDGFKAVNDEGGHEVGDRLLREVALRLQKGLRHGDLVARVGGDEFVVLLPGCRNETTARSLADGIRGGLTAPFELMEGSFCLDASIGIACYPDHGASPELLLAHADRAMYAAKRQRAGRSAGMQGGSAGTTD